MAAKGIPPTVKNFFLVLTSKLTQYDQTVSRRERRPNIYRLGHLLEAAHQAEEEMLAEVSGDATVDQQIADKMVHALANHFTINPRENKFDLPPLRNVIKQLETFLTSGKNPSMV